MPFICVIITEGAYNTTAQIYNAPEKGSGIFVLQNRNDMKNIFLFAAITIATAVQASGTFNMIEINPDHGSEMFIWSDSAKNVYGAGELNNFTELNGKLYFIARDRFDNDELWSTDGTQAGTAQVKDINPAGSSQIGNLVKVGNRLMFMAADNNNWDFDIWSTDGTTAGTVKIADINQSWNNTLAPENIATFGNRMIFCSPTQLMITDGTVAGTDSIMSITTYSQGYGYCELNSKVYFILNNNMGQSEIWRTDGTTMGTEEVLNIEAAPHDIMSVTQMLSFNGKIYMVAAKSGEGNNLFVFDGNIGGQMQKVDIAPGSSSYPAHATVYNGSLYFSASTMTSANMFRISPSNMTPQELVPNASMSWIQSVTYSGNNIYFTAETTQDIHRIDLNTLNHSVTHLNGKNLPNYIQWSNYKADFLAGMGGKIYFAAYDSFNTTQTLLVADEDLNNIHEFMPDGSNTAHPFNAILSCGMADVFDFFVWNDKLIIPANFNDAGRELWILNAAVANGVEEVKLNKSFVLFPNPTQSDLFVRNSNTGYCDQQLQIVNVNGELVMMKTISGGTSVSVAELAAGNYFVTLSENGKTIGTKKLVVTK